jgi:3-oxoacyl-[acyl-carrier protein] reductase
MEIDCPTKGRRGSGDNMPINEVRELRDTVVLISGATSGIGRAAATILVAAGARVAVTGRDHGRLDELTAELGADNCVGVTGDIGVLDTSARLVDAAISRFGRIDSVIASAGIGAYGDFLSLSEHDIVETVTTNFTGTLWTLRAALPHMTDGGDVIIVSSVAGVRGGANEAVYAGTKAAQLVFAGALDREYRERGVRVTSMCPAGVNTRFALGRGRADGDPVLGDFLDPLDVGAAIVYTLTQPRRLRTTQWNMWSAAEGA